MELNGRYTTKQILIASTVLFGLGLSVELLKHAANHTPGKTIKVFGFALDDENESRTGLKLDALRARKRLSERTPHSYGAAANSARFAEKRDASMNRPTQIAVDESKRPDDVEAALKAMAQKQAKADKDSKKKKKKKQTADNDPSNLKASDNQSDQETDLARTQTDTSSTLSGGAGLFSPTEDQADEAPTDPAQFTSVEDWVQFIAADPSYERMYQLIERYQFGEVNLELFQNVLSELMKPSADSEKYLNAVVMALGATPSTESYLKLTQINSALSAENELKVQTRTHLRSYSRLENLNYLGAVISQDPSSNASLEAIKLIEVSIEQVVRSVTPAPGSVGSAGLPGGSETTVTRLSTNITNQYSSLIELLTRISTSSVDSSVRAQAVQTLESLRKYISA